MLPSNWQFIPPAVVDECGHVLSSAAGAGVANTAISAWHNPIVQTIIKWNNAYSSTTMREGPINIFDDIPRVVTAGTLKRNKRNLSTKKHGKVYIPDIIFIYSRPSPCIRRQNTHQ